MMIDNIDLSKKVELIDYLPLFYRKIEQMEAIQDSLSIELSKLKFIEKDVFKQCFIDTATWGLDIWEKELAIKTNYNNSYEQRREIIKAKLRGAGTTTKQMIENVAAAYSNGEVKVIEHNDEYYFEIKFIGTRGIPSNMQELKNTIEQIKPAHLAVQYTYTYLTWQQYDNYNKTWDDWDTLNLSWDELITYNQ